MYSTGTASYWTEITDWTSGSVYGNSGAILWRDTPERAIHTEFWGCEYCGLDNDLNDKFCAGCGSPRKVIRMNIW